VNKLRLQGGEDVHHVHGVRIFPWLKLHEINTIQGPSDGPMKMDQVSAQSRPHQTLDQNSVASLEKGYVQSLDNLV